MTSFYVQKLQVSGSYRLGMKVFWIYFEKDQLLMDLMNVKGVYRTTLAPTGLLIILEVVN